MTSDPYSYRLDPNVPKFPDDRPVIVYDGFCALCSGWARFVLRHDRRAKYRLLSAQSQLGRALYIHYGLDPGDYETNMLIEEGIVWVKSEACIRMAEGLGAPWSLVICLRILPRSVRDRIYESIARNRMRFMGRRQACYVQEGRDRERLIA